jgi:membrane-bound lytic murein transglycosylase D
MARPGLNLPLLVLFGLAIAGCSTTPQSDYSSLPPTPQHSANHDIAGQEAVTLSHGAGALARHAGAPVPPELHEDLFDRIRAGYALPDAQHYAVDREVAKYCSNPEFLDRTFRRGARYLYYIVNEIERRDMPLELALLPVVESAFNPVAYSRSRAAGLWQFIPSTGKHYGLTQNWWMDERRDVLRATDAALTYLQYLNSYFNGDWYLAIAAYNGGEGNVNRAIQRNAAAGKPTDFFSLDLKRETRDYVPKLLAISRIVANPEEYGLQFAAIPNEPFFAVVDPGKQVHLGEAADLAGVTRDDMFALNPAFNRMTTPPNGPYRLLLPVERAEPFRLALASSEGAERVASAATAPPPEVRHHVRRGESLSGIARKYGVSVQTLRAANNLSSSVIHTGETLIVPQGEFSRDTLVAESRPDIVAQLPERQPASAARSSGGTYKVKPGDTLWGVARRHSVTVPALASANGLGPKSQLVAGQRLKIPGGTDVAPTSDASRMTYQVRRGDTLSEIAERFKVSVAQLRSWNRIGSAESLKAGQHIVIYADPRRVNGG